LTKGCKAEGETRLYRAKIGGDLNCEGGQFESKGDVLSLNASGAEIGGFVFLRCGFKAHGGVRLASAKIEGDLDCDDGHFESKGEAPALNANGAEIGGFVFLRNKFNASGEVRVRNAKIGKNLECTGGSFQNKDEALDASKAKIEGSVFLRDGMVAEGKLSFRHARVVRELTLSDVKSLENVIFDLRFASVGTLFNKRNSWPPDKMLFLNGFVFDQIDDQAAPNAEVQLDWINRQPRNEFSSQPFEQLAAVFEKMGLQEDARKVMIAKNKEHGRHLRPPRDWSPPRDWVDWLFEWVDWLFEWFWYKAIGKIIGYGYRPWNAFILSIIVIGTGGDGCSTFNLLRFFQLHMLFARIVERSRYAPSSETGNASAVSLKVV
jgi:hypothetical protein